MLLPSQVVQHSHVGVGVVEVVGVGWVVLLCPVSRKWTVQVKNVLLRLGLVVYAVKTNNLPACRKNKTNKHSVHSDVGHQESSDLPAGQTHMLQEEMQLRVAGWIYRDFEQRQENVLQHLLEVSQLLLCVVDVTVKKKRKLYLF